MLQIRNLSKTYGKHKALDGLSMEIARGSLYGFVGPNGAGKTTTMKIIATLLGADSGIVMVDGVDALRYPAIVKHRIGYMPDFFGVYDNLTVREYMEFYASIYKLAGNVANRRIDELLDLVRLRDKASEMVDDLSRGMKQQLCLARTLIHNPQLLILDEPASGLEPRARIELQKILQSLSEQKVTILLSSHLLQELSEVCTHIGIIDSGKILVQGSVKDIMARQVSENPMFIRVIEGIETAISLLKGNPLVTNIASNEKVISFNFQADEAQEAKLLQSMIHRGVILSSFHRDEGNLEEVFLRLTQT
jgi:ABC-2 type transport system ATP-binding protein